MPMDRHGLGHGHRGERQAASVHMFVPHSWPITGVQVRPSQLYEIIYYCIYIYIGVCDLLIKIQHYLLRSRWDTISLTPTGPTISRFRSSQPTAGPGGWGRPRLEIHRGQLMDRQLMDAIGHAARGRTRLAVLRAALHPRCFGQGFKGKPSAEHFTIFFIYGVPRIHGESHTMLRRTDATDGRGFINKVSHS